MLPPDEGPTYNPVPEELPVREVWSVRATMASGRLSQLELLDQDGVRVATMPACVAVEAPPDGPVRLLVGHSRVEVVT